MIPRIPMLGSPVVYLTQAMGAAETSDRHVDTPPIDSVQLKQFAGKKLPLAFYHLSLWPTQIVDLFPI